MPFWSTQCCYGMLKPNPRGDVKLGAFIWPRVLPVSRCFFRCFVVLGLFMTTEQVWAGWNLSLISCYVLLLSHPPSCFSFPFIFPFMLHTEVQLPRDKPQKAGQEGPAGKFGCKFGFQRGFFGRTRIFVEVGKHRVRWNLKPFEFQKGIIHQAVRCPIFSFCLACKCIFQVLDYSMQIREIPSNELDLILLHSVSFSCHLE